ncbi:hypothetical protein KI387_037486, partial [Taxus chinensis]
RIPPEFVPRLMNVGDEDMVLQCPSGKKWVVKLWSTNTKLEFRHGWGKFVHHHAIEFGDFVVFKYISGSNFKVQIFGRSGCVKNMTVCEPKKIITALEKRYRATNLPSSGEGIEKESSDETEVVAENQRKKAKPTSH